MTSSRKGARRLLGEDEIERGLREVGESAARRGVRVLLVGGVALYHYGSERLTADLDVVSDVLPPDELPRGGRLTIGGVRTSTPSGVPVDWIVRDDDPAYAAVFEEALQHGRRVEGIPIPVVSPEYLAAMKLIGGRPKDDLDLAMLLQAGVVDVPRAREIIKRLLGTYAAQAFDACVSEAEWQAARSGRD